MRKLIRIILNTIPRKYLIRLSYVFMWFGRLWYSGNKVECPVCGGKFRKFLPYGYRNVRPNALCPKCLSLERHRLLWLYLKNKTTFFIDNLKVLHIAPEQCFYKRFKKLQNIHYTTADLESPIADYKCDVQYLPFHENYFDVIICNHVLEHVEDDIKAMKEILRVLKPGAFAILHVPIDYSRDTTYEDTSITNPKERQKHFLQYDHLRLYGTDYPERLKSAGFKIDEKNYLDELDKGSKDRYMLTEKEFMFGYKK